MKSRHLGLIVALAVHAALFVLIAHDARVRPRPDAAARAPLQVRLVPAQLPQKPAAAQPKAATPAAPMLPVPAPQRRVAESITLPPIAAAVEPAASRPLAEAPLKLDTPSPSVAPAGQPSVLEQATRDARSNSPHRAAGERMADALGSDERLVEANQGGGRIIVRKGSECYDVRTARNSDLDPISQSTRPTGRVVMGCK